MIYSKSKEERSKSGEQHACREPSAETEQIIQLCNANGIKVMNHILISSSSEEGTLK